MMTCVMSNPCGAKNVFSALTSVAALLYLVVSPFLRRKTVELNDHLILECCDLLS